MDTYIIITETTIIEVADLYSEPNFFTEDAESVEVKEDPKSFNIYKKKKKKNKKVLDKSDRTCYNKYIKGIIV